MRSLESDQSVAMNDINALLSNKDKEVGIVGKIKERIREISLVHSDMQEAEAFIAQIVNAIPDEEDNKTPEK